jgi:UDP-N-acetylglucosamine--N-acetylmuramyl-(pentapeptide) pyrophosphoryl-undecaprenol N-acetylglucosamine transferase
MQVQAGAKTMWVGGEGGMEADLVKRAGIPYTSIPAAGIHGVGLRNLPRNLSRLMRGVLASRRILREYRPDVLFFTGGYVAGPMAFAGQRIPSLVFVPDIEPGLALKALARFAERIAVTASDSQSYFGKPVDVTGYPLRSELVGWNREQARSALGLSKDQPVLLVFGGSKGARSLNRALNTNLPHLLEAAEIVHISGSLDWDAVQAAKAKLPPEQQARYHIFSYLHEMGQALAAADLVVSRAGASSLGEFPCFGLPAILVPYPHAWRYQKVNAEYLARHGAAVIVEDSRLEDELLDTVKVLLDNPGKLERMRSAMRSLAQPGAAEHIANHLVALAGERDQSDG